MNWRIKAVGPRPVTEIKKVVSQGETGIDKAKKGKRKAYSPDEEGFVDFDVYDRYCLLPGMEIEGPAIIEETESTSIIGQDDFAQVDEYQNLIIKMRA